MNTSDMPSSNTYSALQTDKLSSIKLLLLASYEFRYNSVRNRIEYRRRNKNDSPFKDLTDTDVNSIMFEMKALNLDISYYTLRSLLNSDFVPPYNPFKYYFESLRKWDKTIDFIRMLADRVQTTNDELWRLVLRRWLIGVVACVLDEELINELILIIRGEQDIGKTRLVRALIPLSLKKYYTEEKMNFKDNNSKFRLSECFIINLDEFENIVTSTPEELKSMLSRKSSRLRKPYAALSEDFPRHASFAATINTAVFLKDITGNRRFLVVDAKQIDASEISFLDDVYAQAYHLYLSGEPHYLNKEETQLINEHNKQFEVVHAEYEAIKLYLRPKEDNDHHFESLTATSITRHLSTKTKLQVTAGMIQKVGIALVALGFKPRKSNGVQLYDVVKINNHL